LGTESTTNKMDVAFASTYKKNQFLHTMGSYIYSVFDRFSCYQVKLDYKHT
jgi:hypothetical protein